MFYSLTIEDENIRLTYKDPYRINPVRMYIGTKEEIVDSLLKCADDCSLSGHARARITIKDPEKNEDQVWCGSGRKKDWKQIAMKLANI